MDSRVSACSVSLVNNERLQRGERAGIYVRKFCSDWDSSAAAGWLPPSFPPSLPPWCVCRKPTCCWLVFFNSAKMEGGQYVSEAAMALLRNVARRNAAVPRRAPQCQNVGSHHTCVHPGSICCCRAMQTAAAGKRSHDCKSQPAKSPRLCANSMVSSRKSCGITIRGSHV